MWIRRIQKYWTRAQFGLTAAVMLLLAGTSLAHTADPTCLRALGSTDETPSAEQLREVDRFLSQDSAQIEHPILAFHEVNSAIWQVWRLVKQRTIQDFNLKVLTVFRILRVPSVNVFNLNAIRNPLKEFDRREMDRLFAEAEKNPKLKNFIEATGFDRMPRLLDLLEQLSRRIANEGVVLSAVDRTAAIRALHEFQQNPSPMAPDFDGILGIPTQATELAGFSAKYKEWSSFPADREDLLTSYHTIREFYQAVSLAESEVVYDLGSGYGRVLIYGAILNPRQQFRGVEIVRERAVQSAQAAARLGLTNVSITNRDVLKADYSDGTLFYLFNPFNATTVNRVVLKLWTIAQDHKIRIVTSKERNNWTYNTLITQPWLQTVKVTGSLVILESTFSSRL